MAMFNSYVIYITSGYCTEQCWGSIGIVFFSHISHMQGFLKSFANKIMRQNVEFRKDTNLDSLVNNNML